MPARRRSQRSTALANGAMTVVAPITAVVSAVVPVAVGVALGERPRRLALVGVAVAIVAVALVSGVGGRAERPTSRLHGRAGRPRRYRLRPAVRVPRPHQRRQRGLAAVDRAADLVPGRAAAVVAGHADRRPFLGRRRRADGGRRCPRRSSANLSYLVGTREGLLSLVAVITSMYPASTVVLATSSTTNDSPGSIDPCRVAEPVRRRIRAHQQESRREMAQGQDQVGSPRGPSKADTPR